MQLRPRSTIKRVAVEVEETSSAAGTNLLDLEVEHLVDIAVYSGALPCLQPAPACYACQATPDLRPCRPRTERSLCRIPGASCWLNRSSELGNANTCSFAA